MKEDKLLKQHRWSALAVALLAVVAILRTVASYSTTAQGFDEPCHIAAAMEWLDNRTYSLDPVHPPLARLAIGLPLVAAGEKFPHLPATDPEAQNYNVVGNHIIYDAGHYARTLALARSGMIPFLVLEIVLVFLWTRREFGDVAGVLAAALFSTLPIVLAFSGLAYTDIPASCMQFGLFFAFVAWLERPTARSTVWLGLAAGFAVLTKFTILLFFPAVAIALIACKLLLARHDTRHDARHATRPDESVNRHHVNQPTRRSLRGWLARSALAAAIAVIILWGGYDFSIGHVRESMELTPQNMPSFQHFPGALRGLARDMVTDDWAVPAPALLKGIATAWALNKMATTSYILGKTKVGGWWYFFLVAVAVKTPLPFLVLCLIGTAALFAKGRDGGKSHVRWQTLAPLICAAAVFVVTMGVSYDAGLRHVLIVFPLLAVIAGYGAAFLWQLPRPARFASAARVLAALLLLGQGFTSFAASGDYLAYFNLLAGRDPSKVLVTGCDLDCGQDLYRLAAEFRAQHISHAKLALWSSAQLSSIDLSNTEILEPFQPVTGWVAISARSQRFGDVFHNTYPPHAFNWLSQYQPREMVGETIRLYYIPADAPSPITKE